MRTAVAEMYQPDNNDATPESGLTRGVVGKLGTGSTVTGAGLIRLVGTTNTTSTGQTVTITITPRFNSGTGTIAWACVGTPSKYMPASCR